MSAHAQDHLFSNPLPAGLGSLAIACFGFGAMWLATSLWIYIMLPCFLKSPNILFILGFLLCIALACLVSVNFGLKLAILRQICSLCLFGAGILAIYLAGALSLNLHFGRQVLPISTPFIK